MFSTVYEKTEGVVANLFKPTFVKIMQAKKPVFGEDCGLFAIATATAIANETDPTIYIG